MERIFLRATNLQLLLVTLGLPTILQIVFMGSIFKMLSNEPTIAPEIFLQSLLIIPLMLISFLVIFFGWLWSIVVGLHHKVPENLRMNLNYFKVAFFLSSVYFLLSLGFLMWIGSTILNGMNYDLPNVILYILPFHFLAIFGIVYCVYFVARMLKIIKVQKEVGFRDILWEIFLVAAFPFGTWFLQPEINKWVETDEF